MPEEKTVVQNEATPIDDNGVDAMNDECVDVCRQIAENVFHRVMGWHPLNVAAKLAGAMLVAKMESSDFFEEKYALTERQSDYIKANITAIMVEAADTAVAQVKNFEKEAADFIGRVVIQEMVKISEKTMSAIGQTVNRGALLAMTVVQAKATNEERDELTMWKSKHAGDVTVPTRGVFISTNCIEKIKEDINFLGIKDVTTEVM
jgi:hypothetical protein